MHWILLRVYKGGGEATKVGNEPIFSIFSGFDSYFCCFSLPSLINLSPGQLSIQFPTSWWPAGMSFFQSCEAPRARARRSRLMAQCSCTRMPHCPKTNIKICIKTKPFTFGADSIIYFWFLGQIFVYRTRSLYHFICSGHFRFLMLRFLLPVLLVQCNSIYIYIYAQWTLCS